MLLEALRVIRIAGLILLGEGGTYGKMKGKCVPIRCMLPPFLVLTDMASSTELTQATEICSAPLQMLQNEAALRRQLSTLLVLPILFEMRFIILEETIGCLWKNYYRGTGISMNSIEKFWRALETRQFFQASYTSPPLLGCISWTPCTEIGIQKKEVWRVTYFCSSFIHEQAIISQNVAKRFVTYLNTFKHDNVRSSSIMTSK